MSTIDASNDNNNTIPLNKLSDNITPEEAKHLLSVMMRAKQFDAEEQAIQSKTIEGQLNKYTNVVKGWQYRWFVINPSRGTLEYYMPEEKKKSHPRGCVYLAGSVISPSEEDSQTFIVSAACGDSYKLKASDAKQRQFWVNKLRLVALNHENRIAAQHPPLLASYNSSSSTTNTGKTSSRSSASSQSLEAVRDVLIQTQKNQRQLVNDIEALTSTDEHLLLMKATSHATIMSLEQCFAILQSIQHDR